MVPTAVPASHCHDPGVRQFSFCKLQSSKLLLTNKLVAAVLMWLQVCLGIGQDGAGAGG